MKIIPVAHAALCLVVFFPLLSCATHGISKNPSYWQHISKDENYVLLQTVKGYAKHLSSSISGNQDRIDFRILKGAMTEEGVFAIPPGTMIAPKSVYVDSAPIQYHFVMFVGVVVGGRHDGSRVDFTNLLQLASDGWRPNPEYLRKVDEP
jgi:hypothetical protein